MAKNNLGLRKINFRLGEAKSWIGDGNNPIVSGETPAVQSYEDICPPAEPCPGCPAPK